MPELATAPGWQKQAVDASPRLPKKRMTHNPSQEFFQAGLSKWWQFLSPLIVSRVMETNTRTIRRRLESEGWYLVRRGKHDIYKHAESTETIRLPRHRIVSIGIAQQIATQAGWG